MKPKLLKSLVESEKFGDISYQIGGELVPVLSIQLDGQKGVYFEHHIMLWKDTSINIGILPMKGTLKRLFAGMQIFVTKAEGEGEIAFSRDGAGHIFAIHMKCGEELHVREHQFLAATEDIDYTFERVQGISNMLLGGTGFFIDKFRCVGEEGILWLHGYGNVFEKKLEIGEQIDVEPGAWLYKDLSVGMQTNITKISTGIFAASNIMMNRFTGPGRIGIQSMSLYMNEGK
ncbi:MAG: AIM24 family protein [Fusobacteria bacterium]|nr:AIM24 family protein [Fusobacteriota bacterium]